MIATVQQSALLAALQAASPVTNGKSVPLFGYCQLEAVDDRLWIQTCSGDLHLRAGVEARVHKPGAILIPCDALLETIHETPSGDVVLQVSDYTLKIAIQAGAFQAKIAGTDPSEWINFPPPEDAEVIAISHADLASLYNQVGFAVSTDTTRVSMQGVCCQRINKHLETAATDGHRLAALCLPDTRCETAGPAEWILPIPFLKLVSRLASPESELKLSANSDLVSIDFPPKSPLLECRLTGKLISGPYPNYKQVLPKAFAWDCEIEREHFTQIVRRCRMIAKMGTSEPRILLDPVPNSPLPRIRISGIGVGGEAEESLPLRSQAGTVPPLAFSANYLLEQLGLHESSLIRLRGNGPAQAVCLEFVGFDALTTILMPIRRDK